MALAGCGSASEPSTPAHEVRSIDSQCSDMDDEFSECVITLTDTRKVDCVVYSGYKQGGLSCDWSHVSVVETRRSPSAISSSIFSTVKSKK